MSTSCRGRGDLAFARVRSVEDSPPRSSLLPSDISTFWNGEYITTLKPTSLEDDLISTLLDLLCNCSLKLARRASVKILLELEDCQNLRRWFHDNQNVASFLQKLLESKELLLKQLLKVPGCIVFLLSTVSEGLLSTSTNVRGLTGEFISFLIHSVLDIDVELFYELIQDWLSSPCTFGLDYLIAGGCEQQDETLATVVLRLFQGQYYKLFARKLLEVSTSPDSGQYICRYFDYCTFLLRPEMKPVIIQDLESTEIVDKLVSLALQILETTLLSKNSSDDSPPRQGRFLICSTIHTSCLRRVVRLLQLVQRKYPGYFRGNFLKQSVQLLEEIPRYVQDKDKRIVTVLVDLCFDLCQSSFGMDRRCDLVKVCFQIIDKYEMHSHMFTTVLCERLTQTCSGDQALADAIIEAILNYGSLAHFIDMARTLAGAASPRSLIELCREVSDQVLRKTTEFDLETNSYMQLLLRILATPDIDSHEIRQFRSTFLLDILRELETRHDCNSKEVKGPIKIKIKHPSYAKNWKRTNASLSPLTSVKQCNFCVDADYDKALFNFFQTLVVFEAEVDTAQELLDKILWSRCEKIQSILDQTEFLQRRGSILKLAPLPSTSTISTAMGSSRSSAMEDSSEKSASVSSTPLVLTPRGAETEQGDRENLRIKLHLMENKAKSEKKKKALQELDVKVRTDLKRIQEKTKARKLEMEEKEMRKREVEKKKDKQLRANFQVQRRKWKQKHEQSLQEKLRAEEIRKEYLDLKETSPCLERLFEAGIAQSQAEWEETAGFHITPEVANLVSDTCSPYLESFRKLFHMFASKGDNSGTFHDLSHDSNSMSSKEFLNFLGSFSFIDPTTLHANKALDIFHHHCTGNELSYLEFLNCLRALGEDELILGRLWFTSGFDAVTGSRSPNLVKKGFYASRRGHSSFIREGVCPALRFQVVCEQLRNTAAGDFRLGKCLGTWPKRSLVFPSSEIRVFNPNVLIVLSVVDDLLSSVFDTQFLIQEDSRVEYEYEVNNKEYCVDSKSRLFKLTAAQKTKKVEKKSTQSFIKPPSSSTSALTFTSWYKQHRLKVLELNKQYNPPKMKRHQAERLAIDTEEVAKVIFRVVGIVEKESKRKGLTKSLEAGMSKYNKKIRAQYIQDRRNQRRDSDKERLERNRKVYEKERENILAQARKDREQRDAEMKKQQGMAAREQQLKERKRKERQELLKAKLNCRLLKEKKEAKKKMSNFKEDNLKLLKQKRSKKKTGAKPGEVVRQTDPKAKKPESHSKNGNVASEKAASKTDKDDTVVKKVEKLTTKPVVKEKVPAVAASEGVVDGAVEDVLKETVVQKVASAEVDEVVKEAVKDILVGKEIKHVAEDEVNDVLDDAMKDVLKETVVQKVASAEVDEVVKEAVKDILVEREIKHVAEDEVNDVLDEAMKDVLKETVVQKVTSAEVDEVVKEAVKDILVGKEIKHVAVDEVNDVLDEAMKDVRKGKAMKKSTSDEDDDVVKNIHVEQTSPMEKEEKV